MACAKTFTVKERKRIFDQFRPISSLDHQQLFLTNGISNKPINQLNSNSNSDNEKSSLDNTNNNSAEESEEEEETNSLQNEEAFTLDLSISKKSNLDQRKNDDNNNEILNYSNKPFVDQNSNTITNNSNATSKSLMANSNLKNTSINNFMQFSQLNELDWNNNSLTALDNLNNFQSKQPTDYYTGLESPSIKKAKKNSLNCDNSLADDCG